MSEVTFLVIAEVGFKVMENIGWKRLHVLTHGYYTCI